MPIICTAKASYKKLSGSLELTDTHISWTQDGKKTHSVRVANVEATSLMCSKEGAPQVRMKLSLRKDANDGYTFVFTSPTATALADREIFKKTIIGFISANRQAAELAALRPPVTPLPTAPPPLVSQASKSTLPPPSQASSSRAASVSGSSDPRGTPIIFGNDAAADFRLRKTVLLSNPELSQLHRDLVIGGQITESEFWDGREHILLAQSSLEGQRKGKSGQLVDPRPESVGGDIKIRITPQLVHDIFDEYPVVAKAYNDVVPSKLSEADFWKRYFQSKLFNAHRASIRSTAAQHVVKDDDIFDQYLEKDDDELEPRRYRPGIVGLTVDLAATAEDHGETGNEKDVTMQAGKQRGALPLIRKFNEHSERLLNSALGEGPAAKKPRPDTGDQYGDELDIDDLHDPQSSNGIILEMQDRQRYFEGRMGGTGVMGSDKAPLDIRSLIRHAQASLEPWESNLARLTVKSGETALLSMTQNVAARLDVKARKNDIPEELFRQMTSCQTAANEFLRQFWSATYPPLGDLPNLATATPAQRATKAAKMIGYLSKTHEKVHAIVWTAQQQGLDATRVELAMQPVLDAVNCALNLHRTKKGPRA